MSKKDDLKKLALMGITGGFIVASQTPATAMEMNSFSSNMQFASCGSSCSHTAYNDRGNRGNYPQGGSCNAKGDFAYNSCGGRSSPNSCGGRSISASCGGRSSPNSCGGRSISASCGGRSTPHSCGGRGSDYSYYTADNDTTSSITQDPVVSDNNNAAASKMSEDEFTSKLSAKAKSDYDMLSAEGKAKALKMAGHNCAGKNDCKGLNACRTSKNDCAGKGGCKGQSKCSMTPEQAVKAASMGEKRASLNSNRTYNTR